MAKPIISQINSHIKTQFNSSVGNSAQKLKNKAEYKSAPNLANLRENNTKPYRQAQVKFKFELDLGLKKKDPNKNNAQKAPKKNQADIQVSKKGAQLNIEKEMKLSFKPFKKHDVSVKIDAAATKPQTKKTPPPVPERPNFSSTKTEQVPIRPKRKAPPPPNFDQVDAARKTPPPRPAPTYLNKVKSPSVNLNHMQKGQFRKLDMEKDGNCLFHAFATENHASKNHQNLRNDLSKMIKDQKQNLLKDPGFEAFLSQVKMRSSDLAKLGDETKLSKEQKQDLQIKALADQAKMPNFWNDENADIFMPLLSAMENKNVNLYRPQSDGSIKLDEMHSIKRDQIFKDVKLGNNQNIGEINLLYSGQNHYDLIRK